MEWSRVKEIFIAAVEQTPEDRATFIARSCGGDDELRREVEALLASDADAGSFADRPAAALLMRDSAPRRRLQPGDRVGLYEITGFIAAGGMGEVYRARHTVLGADVAIKSVRFESSGEAASRRLIREARHASVLKHPGICTIHEVVVAEAGPFIVMELVDGRSLHELVREHPLRLDDTLSCAIQVARALEHAHSHGIVHRDLKGSNVVVDTAGRAVVLDFGLARRLPGAADAGSSGSTITQAGVLAGTPSHMAPEVLLGRDADERSDVWALGILLFEMLSGELPFRGETPFETTSSILSDAVPPLRTRVPLALRLVIERCLMKEPDARYARAAHVATALDAIRRRRAWPLIGPLLVSVRRRTLVRGAAVAVGAAALLFAAVQLPQRLRGEPVSSIALLPLANGTGDPAEQYYADGVTEALVEQLGATTGIRVVALASVARVVATTTSPAEIAERLGVAAIVEGTVRRFGERVLLSLQLVRPSDGRVIWAESFERDSREVLAVQADIVRALALEARLAVRPIAREGLNAVRAVAPGVYEAYLHGRYEYNQRTQQSLERAIAHFTRATELDPTYAPAFAALADCYNQFATFMLGSGSPKVYRPLAEQAAIRALQLDPASAEAHAALAYVHHYNWRWEEAERGFLRSLELNPNNPLAHVWYANLLVSLDRPEEALAQMLAARELDPYGLIVNTGYGWVLHAAGRLEEAEQQLRFTIELDSMYPQAHWRLAYLLLARQRDEEARALMDRVLLHTDSASSVLAHVGQLELRRGRRDAARAILDELLGRSRAAYVPPAMIGSLYRGLGDIESFLTWYEKAFDERTNGLAYSRPDTTGALYRREPRLRALWARIPPRPARPVR